VIVKIHSRGAGSGSGPVDYLLGKDRQRSDARVLRGDAERTRELIDGCDFARGYTSGVLVLSGGRHCRARKSAADGRMGTDTDDRSRQRPVRLSVG